MHRQMECQFWNQNNTTNIIQSRCTSLIQNFYLEPIFSPRLILTVEHRSDWIFLSYWTGYGCKTGNKSVRLDALFEFLKSTPTHTLNNSPKPNLYLCLIHSYAALAMLFVDLEILSLPFHLPYVYHLLCLDGYFAHLHI